MRFLPQEEPAHLSSQSGHGNRHRATRHPGKRLPAHPELVKYQLALKKISQRLDRYADHELPEGGVLDLLEETRAQVLSLHLARKQLERRGNKKNGHQRRRHK